MKKGKKFKKGDTIICINGSGTGYDTGDVLTVRGTEAFGIYGNGYSIEGSPYLIYYFDEDKFELYDYEIPYEFESDKKDTFELFMKWLEQQDNLTDEEYQLVKRYKWFMKGD